jgi:hypothetical protein
MPPDPEDVHLGQVRRQRSTLQADSWIGFLLAHTKTHTQKKNIYTVYIHIYINYIWYIDIYRYICIYVCMRVCVWKSDKLYEHGLRFAFCISVLLSFRSMCVQNHVQLWSGKGWLDGYHCVLWHSLVRLHNGKRCALRIYDNLADAWHQRSHAVGWSCPEFGWGLRAENMLNM